MREILSGNEAIARGAWEAGVLLAAAYPGTPSTEILENTARYAEIYSEWAPNEKVALEVGLGSSFAGARTLVAMKHVGVNVAADPLMTASYTGVEGGLVIISADEPGQHSSQNEQDNRRYGPFAKIPVIEPADSQEAKDFLLEAFDLSEEYDTPVLFRTTTRLSHSKSVVELGERPSAQALDHIPRNTPKYTMLPGYSRARHPLVEERMARLRERAAELPLNRLELRQSKIGRRVGIIASGVVYEYAKEAFSEASFLKLGLTHPIPAPLVARLREHVESLYVVEELDPFLEEQIRLLGIRIDGGKNLLPLCGELDARLIAQRLTEAGASGATDSLLEATATPVEGLPLRPPALCPGCSHRGIFAVLSRLKVYVSGDIGCYTLGALPPFEAMHSCIAMGAGIGMAHGMAKVVRPGAKLKEKAVAVIGDSTFFHSGMTPLLNVAWNRSDAVVILLDNRTTAMTGGQDHPGTGSTLMGQEAPPIDLTGLIKALGIERVSEVDPYDLSEIEEVLRRELEAEGPAVVIARGPCVLEYKVTDTPLQVDRDLCNGCRRCLTAGCIALTLVQEEKTAYIQIDEDQCNGCGVCAQLCNFEAIVSAIGAEA
ncbi:MAG: thiamine pyrophosphate-dependent enzyme [Thermoleophilia bacterium]